jgi:outer membrane protein OmpA-like peptidoglycan-associated protein
MRIRHFIGLLSLCALHLAVAQTPAPSAEQMIEQLKAPVRTRSLRNLAVQAASIGHEASNAASTPPGQAALSLQILFEFNSAQVSAASQSALSTLATALQSPQLRDARFAIEGHTDAKGGADYNLKLSALRAQAVRDILKAQGVQEERLRPVGKGATELLSAEQPFAAENRRVRIVNLE